MSFILLELARNPKVQSVLRDEIRKTEASVHARGDPRLTAADLEAMPYLNAVIKVIGVSLACTISIRSIGRRLHLSAAHILRMACQDSILPLSKPILTQSGDMINEVLVPKGTEIVISIAPYNR